MEPPHRRSDLASNFSSPYLASLIGRNGLTVVCITGMPGAGKSTAAESLKEIGFEVFSMGDDIRAEARRRGLSASDENLGKLMQELREKRGMGAVAELSVQRILNQKPEKNICIDGIRNHEEVIAFRRVGSVYVLAVHASPSRRFEFLSIRKRDDAPLTRKDFEARDERELSVGIGKVIALSDEIVSNSVSVADLRANVRKRVELLIGGKRK